MPTCQNCGGHVSPDYVRVFCPDDVDEPRVCPFCEDLKRGTGGEPVESRATRREHRGL